MSQAFVGRIILPLQPGLAQHAAGRYAAGDPVLAHVRDTVTPAGPRL